MLNVKFLSRAIPYGVSRFANHLPRVSNRSIHSTSGKEIIKANKDTQLFSWVKQGGFIPKPIVRAKGVYIYDADEKGYLDLGSQNVNVNVGHSHPHVIKAMTDQAKELGYVHSVFASAIRGKLGEKLAEITPGDLKKVFFTSGGGDGIENAIKMARMYTGKSVILTRAQSYHGPNFGALASSGDTRRLPFLSTLPSGHVHVEDSGCYRQSWDDNSACSGDEAARNLEKAIQQNGPGNIAAIMMEGASGSSGCLRYADDLWPKLRELADKYNILLIADEVMSGFGRTGKWFAVDHANVVPDILVMAKGITGAHLPLGGVMVSDKIAAHFDDNPLVCGLTYSAHPTCLAAAVATLEVYEQENLISRSAEMGEYLGAEVSKLREKHPSIVDFRQTGLLSCIEVVLDKSKPPPLTPDYAPPEQAAVMDQIKNSMADNGVITYMRWNLIFIAPPLTITKAELDTGLSVISKALEISDAVLEKNSKAQTS